MGTAFPNPGVMEGEFLERGGDALGFPDLCSWTVDLNEFDNPVAFGGYAGHVYRLIPPSGDPGAAVAAKVYTRARPHLEWRYGHLESLQRRRATPSCFVPVRFRPDGFVWCSPEGGQTLQSPVVVTPWVGPHNLRSAVETEFDAETYDAGRWIRAWLEIVSAMSSAGFAHCDLQHENIRVLDDSTLRLIDYDGCFLPVTDGHRFNTDERGKSGYQHPERDPRFHSEAADRFPALVILTTLAGLTGEAMQEEEPSDTGLYLEEGDLMEPGRSVRLLRLRETSEASRMLCDELARAAKRPEREAPDVVSLAQEALRLLAPDPPRPLPSKPPAATPEPGPEPPAPEPRAPAPEPAAAVPEPEPPAPGPPASARRTFSSSAEAVIPDNDIDGVRTYVSVDARGAVRELAAHVEIEHTNVGDLIITLEAPDGRAAVLHDREGGNRADLDATFASADGRPIADLVGAPAMGSWSLWVADNDLLDHGRLLGWSLTLAIADDLGG